MVRKAHTGKSRMRWAALLLPLVIPRLMQAQDIDPRELAYNTDVSRRGTAAGAMLEIGIGARAEALGGAFAAIADDPSALYWNPAGITEVKSLAVQATHTSWLVDTQFNAVDLVVPISSISWALGFHLALLDYGENPVRTVFSPNGTGETYTALDMVAGLYWAMAITDRISVGLGFKYFHQRIWHVGGSAVAADLAILYKTSLKGLRLGGSISNLGPEFALGGRDLTRVMDADGRQNTFFNNERVPVQLKTESYSLPLLFRVALAYEQEFDSRNSLVIAANVNHPSHDVESVDLGVEARTFNSVFLRAGYHSLFASEAADGLTLGAGIRYKVLGSATITIDYAWSDWTILDSVNRFTVGISAY